MAKNIILLFAIFLAGWNASAQNKNSSGIFIIIHIDAMPEYARPAAALLDSLRDESLWDKGVKSFKVLQEPSRPNHFTLVEEWVDRDAYDAYVATAHVRAFRDRIQPMLGSPFDERIHNEVKK